MRGVDSMANTTNSSVRVEQLNEKTIAAMWEAKRLSRDPSVKRYSNIEDALRELKE